MDAGLEWMIEADGCAPGALRDLAILRTLLDDVVDRLGLKVVGAPVWHAFPGEGGVTGLYLLSESHLAVHTYPEVTLVTLNLYCCRPRPEYPWRAVLSERLGARRVRVRRLSRSLAAPEAADG